MRAFSLVELSIVLVILGLLVGGILAGQSLIRAAELRSQLRDFESVSTAHYAFREKYLCMAGDCPNISRFFSTIIDGNGDGRVACWPSTGPNECGTYFFTMETAGLLEARRRADYPALDYRGGTIGQNYLYLHYEDRYAGGGYTPPTLLGSGYAWINYAGPNNPWANGAALRPEDAWNLDNKIDDGQPQIGIFMAANGGIADGSYSPDCVDGTAYRLTFSSTACRAFYRIE